MKVFYITSSGPGAGKTTVIAGLASYLQKQGKKVGYLKPVALKSGVGGDTSDALFFQEFLKLKEKLDTICPLQLTPDESKAMGQKESLPENVLRAFAEVSAGKDVVFLEGLSGISSGQPEGRLGSRLADKTGAEVIVVANCPADKVEENLNQAQANFGKSFRGIIVNSMSPGQIEAFREAWLPSLKGAGASILGFLPRDRALAAITLGDLVKGLGAKSVNAFDGVEELVENVMAGSHGIDPGLYYYGQRDKKVVITRSDRPDMQVAALRTPTLALILAGGSQAYHEALSQAEVARVPVFTVPGKTEDVIVKTGELIKQGPFRQVRKVERIEKLLRENVDLRAIV